MWGSYERWSVTRVMWGWLRAVISHSGHVRVVTSGDQSLGSCEGGYERWSVTRVMWGWLLAVISHSGHVSVVTSGDQSLGSCEGGYERWSVTRVMWGWLRAVISHSGHVRVLQAVIRKECGYCERAKLIDLMQSTSSPHVTKRETDSGRKAGYYDTILQCQFEWQKWPTVYGAQVQWSSLKLPRKQIQFLIMRVWYNITQKVRNNETAS